MKKILTALLLCCMSAVSQAAGIVSFIFDDTAASHGKSVAPLFDSRGVKAGFAVASGRVKSDPELGTTWAQMRKMQASGHEFLGHSHSHADLRLAGVSKTILDREFLSSKIIMEREGLFIRTFVAPYSSVAAEYMEPYVRPTYSYAFTVYKPTVADAVQNSPLDVHALHRTNLWMVGLTGAMEAIDAAVAQDGMVVFYDHDPMLVSNPRSMPFTELRQVLDYAIASGAAVLIPRQAIALQKRRDAARLSN